MHRGGAGSGVAAVFSSRVLAGSAFVEFVIEFVMAELGLRVRFPVINNFAIKLTLNLTIQDLQFFIRYYAEVCGERVIRSEMQVVVHGGSFRP